jgi:hypothetical protein
MWRYLPKKYSLGMLARLEHSMADIYPFPEASKGGGSGPEDPMLERRVDRLEDDVREIKNDLSDIKQILARLEGRFDALDAKIDARPTIWSLTVALVGAVLASGGLALAIARIALQ